MCQAQAKGMARGPLQQLSYCVECRPFPWVQEQCWLGIDLVFLKNMLIGLWTAALTHKVRGHQVFNMCLPQVLVHFDNTFLIDLIFWFI